MAIYFSSIYDINLCMYNYMCVYELVECSSRATYIQMLLMNYIIKERERERTERKSIEGGIGAPQFEDIVR
ncbi:hypothetical protein Scep_012903 [Stephania cephalantha]|uniref:Uncharacterized protein n=1 Tax=Stephania cephalantha TaxID=152367 RepID=A0AAP0PA06_9MAGN